MAKVLDYGFDIGKFDLQSHKYVHFRNNTFGKGINFLIPSVMG